MEYGKGFMYGFDLILDKCKAIPSCLDKLNELYGDDRNAKQIYTDLTFYMLQMIWKESGSTGTLFLGIGGINDQMAFSSKVHSFDFAVYHDAIDTTEYTRLYNQNRGSIIRVWNDGGPNYNSPSKFLNWYTQITMDFNGSMAFYKGQWKKAFNTLSNDKLKAVYMMGGVEINKQIETLPYIKGTINRIGLASMNQFYSPKQTADFFDFIEQKHILQFVVSNNKVKSMSLRANRQQKLDKYFTTNNLGSSDSNLYQFYLNYFSQNHVGAIKAFDLIVAGYLVGTASNYVESIMWYDDVYGATLLTDTCDIKTIAKLDLKDLSLVQNTLQFKRVFQIK